MSKKYGEKLRKLRLARNLKQKDVAEAIGIRPQTLCDYEHGRCEPSWEVLRKLLRLYHVNHDIYVIKEESYLLLDDLEDISLEKIQKTVEIDDKLKKKKKSDK